MRAMGTDVKPQGDEEELSAELEWSQCLHQSLMSAYSLYDNVQGCEKNILESYWILDLIAIYPIHLPTK